MTEANDMTEEEARAGWAVPTREVVYEMLRRPGKVPFSLEQRKRILKVVEKDVLIGRDLPFAEDAILHTWVQGE